jgi:heptaprenylglyceryl phosphate synthase
VAQAGADVLVVGNALEEDPGLALSIKSAIHR